MLVKFSRDAVAENFDRDLIELPFAPIEPEFLFMGCNRRDFKKIICEVGG